MQVQQTITAPIVNELSEFNNHYQSLFTSKETVTNMLLNSLSEKRGKMLRPMLTLLVAKCYGEVKPAIYNIASALELIHLASLIHDDVVDNSSERRGKPSINALFNNKMAVLFGDYVVARALEQLSLSGNMEHILLLSQLVQTLSEGELIQLDTVNNQELSEELYFKIIKKKTACLFSTAAKMAALESDFSSKTDSDTFARFGLLLGLSFQIKDDIFDYFSSYQTGKPSGNDLLEGKFTLPAIWSLTHSDLDWSSHIKAIKDGTATIRQREDIIEYTIKSGGIEYAQNKMVKLKDEALQILPSWVPEELFNALEAYMDFIINRNK